MNDANGGAGMRAITYYGLVRDGRDYAEVEVRREGGRQVSQTMTGNRYKTWAEATRANEARNAEVVRS